MSEDRIDKLIRENAPGYNMPRNEPLDAIWANIENRLDATANGRAHTKGLSWKSVALVLAASLAIGFFAGRVTESHEQRSVATVSDERSDSIEAVMAPFRQAASRYLGQTAVLLLALESTSDGRLDTIITRRAGELLTTTRLLLDSPAAQDSQFRTLMSDLELVLAQINRMEARRVNTDVRLISQALRERDLLPRIHSAAARAAGN